MEREPASEESEAPGEGQEDPVEIVAEFGDEGASSDIEIVPRGDRLPPNLFLVAAPGVVLFPDFAVPVVLRNPWAERTINQAQTQSEFLGVAAYTDDGTEEQDDGAPPDPDRLSEFGCLVRIVRSLQMPDGTRTVLLQGVRRFRIERLLRRRPYLIAKVSYPDEKIPSDDESEALARNVRNLLGQVLAETPGAGDEMGVAILNIERKGSLADFAGAFFVKDATVRRTLLSELDVGVRLRKVNEELTRELHILHLGNRIQDEIREKIEKRQREFFLREQLKAIRGELGEEQDERALEVESFEKRMAEKDIPEEVRARAEEDLARLKVIPVESPESGVMRSYLDWLLSVPWGSETEDLKDLARAREILDRDHAGLEEIKERIAEFLAVRQRVPAHQGPILCLVGPPGVGKTSLGHSIAEALGREFVRVSLGGMHDEAEIRGHRRTYIGSLPGRIVRGLKNAGSMNPVFMLDELDKVGQDFRGDPAAALLEVLDPAQNSNFSDHYLEVPLDLSRVFFIATANDLDPVPPPLRDRLEVIEMSGYITEEKLEIARRFLVPRQLAEHGLRRADCSIHQAALRLVISGYSREAGVRTLEKCIARICRKVATRLTEEGAGKIKVTAASLPEYLGPQKFVVEEDRRGPVPGVAQGLAWTPVGGEVLEVEVVRLPRSRKELELTGMLGEVMTESARIAVSFVRGQAEELDVSEPLGAEEGLHFHVPAGAVRKDGPSAGITLATALLSLLRGEGIRPRLAMTGELTLTGRVLVVGGIRDKILAARRRGIREVILPAGNRNDVDEIPEHLRKGMRFHFVQHYTEVPPLVFRKGRRSSG